MPGGLNMCRPLRGFVDDRATITWRVPAALTPEHFVAHVAGRERGCKKGSTTHLDRELCSIFGVKAVELIAADK